MLKSKLSNLIFTISSLFLTIPSVQGHGYLKSPRSRNWVAREDGTSEGGPQSTGIPEQDHCPHCLNSKFANDICSKGNAVTSYDHWWDINGTPMPWTSQDTYKEGDEITVETVLTTNHAGHMDMYICPLGDSSSQECLWDNPLTMIRDELYGGPNDPDYPERAYFANDQSTFKHTYKLPEGVCGERVLMQWRYITANSCFPPGYKTPGVAAKLQELGWLRASGMSDCQYPYDPTGATGAGKPEQFWNCAEVTITCNNPTVSPAPTLPPQPTPEITSAPIGSPTNSPTGSFGYCNYGGTHDNSRDQCDGLVEGGPWCNENQSQCEGSCNGNWCTTAAPTAPTPVTTNPTARPSYPVTESPTITPSIEPTQCDEDPADEFFHRMKKGKALFKSCHWLGKKSPKRIKNMCEDKTDSYNGIGPAKEICVVTCGSCPTASPTSNPTKSPTKSPAKQVTAAPTAPSTKAPTASPVSSNDVCCSQFFNICKDNPWCQESEDNCTTCNGVFLPNLPLQCIPRYGLCSDNEDGCCYPSTCVSGGNVKQCMYTP